jgi:hypothetical protein
MVGVVLTVLIFFLSGTVISTIGAMTGLGGGFLAVPFLILVWGRNRPDAVLTSFVLILGNSVSSSISYIRSRMVEGRLALVMFLCTVPSVVIGYLLLQRIHSAIFDIAFAAILVVVTVLTLRTKRDKDAEKRRDIKIRDIPPLVYALSFFAGFLGSLFGIGGGAVFMPTQVGLMKMRVRIAVATSMTVIAAMAFFRVFIVSGGVFDYAIAIPFMMGGMVGGQIGAGIAKRMKGKYLLYALAACLLFIALYMGGSAVLGLL